MSSNTTNSSDYDETTNSETSSSSKSSNSESSSISDSESSRNVSDDDSSFYSSSRNQSSTNSSNTSSESESSSRIFSPKEERRKTKKGSWKKKKMWIITIISFSVIFFLNIILIVILITYQIRRRTIRRRNNNNFQKDYLYKIFFMNGENNETYHGIIKEKKNVRGYSYVDENGGYGYIYPLDYNGVDGPKNVYKVVGRCKCCYECTEDNNCEENMYCEENYCVECKKDENCGVGKICVNGGCLNGDSCRDNIECNDDEVCNNDGKCVKGCRSDEICGKKQICNWNDECVVGCKNDNNCNKGEMCVDFECTSMGCRNNFDCGDYNHACIENKCVSIKDSTKCSGDNDCGSDYYCELEFQICVKMRKDTIIGRRNTDVATVIGCSVVGMITLLVVASTYSVAVYMGKRELHSECEQKCSDHYYTFSETNLDEFDVEMSEKYNYKVSSECTGKCQVNEEIKNPAVLQIAVDGCSYRTYTDTIIIESDLVQYHMHPQAVEVFHTVLNAYCQTFQINNIPQGGNLRAVLCQGDDDSIDCVLSDIDDPLYPLDSGPDN